MEAKGKEKLEQEEEEQPSVASKTKENEAIGQVILTYVMLYYIILADSERFVSTAEGCRCAPSC